MKGFHPRITARATTGALIASLAVVVAASESRADCAHGVIWVNGPIQPGHFLDPLIAGEPATGPAQALPAPDRPKPCQGPSCSRPPALPSAPSVAVTRSIAPWACLGPLPPLPDRDSLLLPRDADGPRPVRAGLSIFHPPRPRPDRPVA